MQAPKHITHKSCDAQTTKKKEKKKVIHELYIFFFFIFNRFMNNFHMNFFGIGLSVGTNTACIKNKKQEKKPSLRKM